MKHIRITSLDRPALAQSDGGPLDNKEQDPIAFLDGFRGLLGSYKTLDVAL